MRRIGFLLLLTLIALLAACGDGGAASGRAGQGGAAAAGAAEGNAAPGEEGAAVTAPAGRRSQPLVITDATGKTHVFETVPQRIVSISPAETEILFALGLDGRIVAVSDYDDYPPETASKERVGGIIDPNEELLLALRPDLVVAGLSLDPNVTERLRQLGLPVIQLKADSVDDVFLNIRLLGQITGTEEAAERLEADMRGVMRSVSETVARLGEGDRRKVYVEIAPGWTVGSGTYLHELLTIAGGINVAGDVPGWNMINEEAVIAADPDVILYARGLVDFDSGRPLDELIRARGGWESIRAVRDGRVIGIEENLMARPGPRMAAALEEIAAALYPELTDWETASE